MMNIATAIGVTELRIEGYEEAKKILLEEDNLLKEEPKVEKQMLASLDNNIKACELAIKCMELVEEDLYKN